MRSPEVVEEWAPRFEHLAAFSTTGVRPDTDLLPLEDHGALRGPARARRRAERDAARRLARDAVLLPRDDEGLAVHLRPAGAEDHAAELALPRRLSVREDPPVVRALAEDRQRAMDEHIRIGGEFPSIHNHTTYSFGIDDQEFMTAFECDEPADFMHLMLTLRESRGEPLHRARHADLRRPPRADARACSTRWTARPHASRPDSLVRVSSRTRPGRAR